MNPDTRKSLESLVVESDAGGVAFVTALKKLARQCDEALGTLDSATNMLEAAQHAGKQLKVSLPTQGLSEIAKGLA